MKLSAGHQEKIRSILKTLPELPGVYRMLNKSGEIIYVGKAVNLKKRVSSYFQKTHLDPKTASLVDNIEDIETTVTHTESEALLLENNLIKQHLPRYNILYRDDKSYPYIYISTEQDFPRLAFHRGARSGKGRYFGPYMSAGAVRETLAVLQKVFSVRQCSESFYKNRSRPCLQYQIKRCTAPCVGLIDKRMYGEEVNHVIMFLEGKSNELNDLLIEEMEAASKRLDYETAARLRDQIGNLRRIQEKQYITEGEGNYDVVAAVTRSGVSCVQLFTIRDGQNLGNKAFFPKRTQTESDSDLINAFLAQHYLESAGSNNRKIPAKIFISEKVPDMDILTELLTRQAGRKVTIQSNVRGSRSKWIQMAMHNAELAVSARLASNVSMLSRLEKLRDVFSLDEIPARLECFDISHTMGEATVASCVVFGNEGPIKSEYRRYNIEGITPGDDYAAMEQALMRRYRKVSDDDGKLPDVLFIDGGKGQVSRAQDVFDELQIGSVLLIGVAKGPTRKAGMETLILSGSLSEQQSEFILPADSPALHLIQQIRDEAHRFAISGHRNRRKKKRSRSVLEEIEGLGPKRRQKLLTHFGGLQEVSRAGVDDLASIPGISKQLARRIYDSFHPDSNS
jgi:excinuclease ABC subunit C